MAQSIKRSRQVADIIRHEIAFSLKKDVQDPRLRALSITSVDVSPDLRHANIYFVPSQLADLADIKKALTKATGFFRSMLAERMATRYVPRIAFVYDEALERGSRISDLIHQVLPPDENAEN